jgi:hypothetical protein
MPTPRSQSQIGQNRHLRRQRTVPFEAGVALSVVVRWVPIKTRCEWHASGTAGEDDPGSGVADRHRLNHRVRLVLGDHCLAGRSLEGAGPVPHRLVVGADFVTISGRSRCIHRPSRGVLPTARRRRGSIKRTRWAWVAWSMLAVFIVSMVFGIILAVANGTFQQDAANQVMLFVGFSAFMVVGARIVAHRPSNAIGWIFSGHRVASRPWCKRATGVGSLEPARARRRTYTRGIRSIPDRAHPR